ncbi:MAG TPA: carboxylating nicotinate-nucleotide diphosphorylase [Vicinamibacterales bacterium]|nr:carboxylating nicotinate-nucleotide diphosphorylase [Vicinamibacterales bacterium]
MTGPALTFESYRDLVARALREDVGAGDVTSALTIDRDQQARGILLAKTPLVVAGLDVAAEVFRQCDPAAAFSIHHPDGAACDAGLVIAEVTGRAQALLTAERTALNFLQRLSGIATETQRYVAAASGRITVLDTRKTMPTFRDLEKYAVRCGGGTNHRQRLDDGVLIKDNHKRLAGGITGVLARARTATLPVEVEVETLAELDEALAAGAARVLVDNFSLADQHEAVRRCRGRATVEISGGVTLERLPAIAATGADFVSVGALTHSVRAADISFELEPS